MTKSRRTLIHSARALGRTAAFFLKVFPMLPSRPVDWVTSAPVVEKVSYPSLGGWVEGDLYRPSSAGSHPGIIVCLGVVPFEVDHPQVPVLGRALARAGFTALLYWSPAMRDLRLEPEDIENIPLAYDWLVQREDVDASRSGLLGTCVGGSFALMAAAHPLIREKVNFVAAYAPFASMWTFAADIASATRNINGSREPWTVDQLTRRVFVHSLTSELEAGEAGQLRDAFAGGPTPFDPSGLSAEGKLVYDVLTSESVKTAQAALLRLPGGMQERLTVMSPLRYAADIHAPVVVHLHDTGDLLIPISESRQLQAVLNGQGVRYTEMQFQHLDPVKGRLPLWKLARELGKFFRTIYPVFEQSVPRG